MVNRTENTHPDQQTGQRLRRSAFDLQHSKFHSLNAFLALVLANLVLQPLTEPDFGWHLRTGLDLIRQHGRLPLFDPYSHTMPDWPWVEHSWLTDLLIALGYSIGGPLAVILLFGSVTAAAWLVAVRCAETSAPVRWMASVLSLCVALPFLGARTQLITLLGLALLMWLLSRVRKDDRNAIWWIPPLFLLWANLHGGFTAGLFFLAMVLVLSWLVRVVIPGRDEGPAAVPGRALWGLALATGLGAVLTLFNPYGWHLHREIFDSLSDRFMIQTLQEWHPVSADTLAGKMFIVYIMVLGLSVVCWYRRVEPVRWGILLVFLLLAARHLRNIPLFLIVSLPLLAELLDTALRQGALLFPFKRVSLRQWTAGGTFALGLFLLYAGPDHLLRIWRFGVSPAVAFQSTSYPIEAIEWIQTHRDRLGARPIHDYQYGGFILWWLPGTKVFIDGRMPAWRLGDRQIFPDYIKILESDPPQMDLLEKYGIDWALVKRESPLARRLGEVPTWRKEYEDTKVVIYADEGKRMSGSTGYSKTTDLEAR